jgi:hypothetical protein
MSNLLNWKLIPNFSNYECSDTGLFRRNGRMLRTTTHPKGYKNIRLYKNGKQHTFRAHRVVYETFVGFIPSDKEINHLDGIKDNNSILNLQCCSHSENMKHAIDTQLLKIKIGKDCVLSKPIVGKHIQTGELVQFDSQADARRFGFNQGNIQAVLQGKRNHHKQFTWHYA